MTLVRKVCLLGFGEVAKVLAADMAAEIELVAYDWQFDNPESLPSLSIVDNNRVEAVTAASAAAQDCQLVISAVTAAQDLPAALSVLDGLHARTLFLDLNSVSPATKISVADAVETAGGHYIEAAILSPIGPQRMAAPILVGGPHAENFLSLGRHLGFSGMQHCSPQLGKAAAVKMCRSIMVKGVETLLTESLLAARYYGVEDAVMTSLNNLIPWTDWPEQADYMIRRSLKHGERRAEEMYEAAKTVTQAGINPCMAKACAGRQTWASQFSDALPSQTLGPLLDCINTAIKKQTPGVNTS